LAIGNPVALEASADERDTGVHLDDDHPAVGRVDRELDVAAAGVHPTARTIAIAVSRIRWYSGR